MLMLLLPRCICDWGVPLRETVGLWFLEFMPLCDQLLDIICE
jgi:hypothetical protein